MEALLFYGIVFDSCHYGSYFEEEVTADFEDADFADKIYNAFSDALAPGGEQDSIFGDTGVTLQAPLRDLYCVTGFYTVEDTRQRYLAVEKSLSRTYEVEELGHLDSVDDEKTWDGIIKQAIRLLEKEIEKQAGIRPRIDDKPQWHLAVSWE